MPNDFRQTPEYSAQQMIRRVIRQAKTLTRAERDVTLVIHADAGASHQSVVNVLEAARLAGLAVLPATDCPRAKP